MSDTEPTVDASIEELSTLLQHSRRRYVLWYLDRNAGPTSIDILSRRIAAHEAETTAGPTQRDERAVRSSLHHVHLPMLVDAGLVTYDAQQGVVGRGSREVERLLAGVNRFQIHCHFTDRGTLAPNCTDCVFD